MDHSYSEESDSMVDLESGEKTSEDDGIEDLDVVGKNAKKMLGSRRSGCNGFGGSGWNIDGLGSSNNVLQSGEVEGKAANMVEMKMAKEKRRNRSSKKPPKPPRPPNSPSLDVADMKLVREISELARLRRARIERRKEIKKRRAGKASSSNANLIALVITTLFCFVIIFQGKPSVALRKVELVTIGKQTQGQISSAIYQDFMILFKAEDFVVLHSLG